MGITDFVNVLTLTEKTSSKGGHDAGKSLVGCVDLSSVDLLSALIIIRSTERIVTVLAPASSAFWISSC